MAWGTCLRSSWRLRAGLGRCQPLAVVALMVAGGLLGAGCGEEVQGCDGNKLETVATAPDVTSFRYVEQLTGDSYTLIFAADFTDADGDLHAGTAEIFLGGKSPAVTFQMQDSFAEAALATNATSGTLAFPLRLDESLSSGVAVRVGVQLVDAAKQRSNCATVDLQFTVTPAST